MTSERIDLHQELENFFGFDKFKGDQEEIIRSVLDGKDTFVIMPTGGGKSLCYQLPALIMEGTAIVISPLIALMKNQVDSVRGYSEGDYVAHFLNSSLNKSEVKVVKEDILSGRTKLLYVAPETLTKEENIEFFQKINISFVAVDEAHCISEWGHDFRPEYRRIREMLELMGDNIPVVALTATATEKVRTDIVKNLNMDGVRSFVSSFNRDNLFYEVRPKKSKEQAIKEIVQIAKSFDGQSGIVYVHSRKATEEIAKVLVVNGIKAAPYHAGLDAKTRSRVQDEFLMEDIDVICATIAFGMGIDKPDVRFVVHFDIPKSIENYYQETGRGGRDGLVGKCVAFFSHKDLLRLEKFLRDKPVAEREMGAHLLNEMSGYAETGDCRRRFLLHYFGEMYNQDGCGDMCDNCKYPKERVEVKEQMVIGIKSIEALKENFGAKVLIEFLTGAKTKEMQDFGFDTYPLYGAGADYDEVFWHSIFRQGLMREYIGKEIERYGTLYVKDGGRDFVKSPQSLVMPINRDFGEDSPYYDAPVAKTLALDPVLMKMLQDLRKGLAKEHGVPPWVIFQDPSLQEIATQYPITVEEMQNISGVSAGKARKYGKPFLEMVKEYVEENDIERPMDFVVKQVANKSKIKVAIIQGVDRKIPFEDIAYTSNLKLYELMDEMDIIVSSGTKLNIDYYLNEVVDEGICEEIYDYLMEAESDSIDEAFVELKEDDITLEEIQLVRIKFLSEVAN